MEHIDDYERVTKIRNNKRIKEHLEFMTKKSAQIDFVNFVIKLTLIVTAFNFMYWIANR